MTRRVERIITADIVAHVLAAIGGYPAPARSADYHQRTGANKPVFVIRLSPQSGDGVRALRGFLKAALRHFNLRCVSISEEFLPELIVEHLETEDGDAWGPTLPFDDGRFYARVGPRSGRRTRWRSIRIGTHQQQQEDEMDKSNLEKLKHYATTTRSPLVFGGCTFIRWDYKNGKYCIGKNNTDITGKKLVADLPDVMGGFQRLEQKKKPEYAVVRILGDLDPIERDELGETDKSKWIEERDPWQPVSIAPFYDPETRQVFVFPAIYGARDAVANLLEAFADHSAAHPEAADHLPIVQLCVREYIKNDGSPGYAVQFDIDGWAERPAAVMHIQPPPLSITVTETSKVSNGKSAPANSSKPKSSTDDKTAKPKRKIAIPGKSEYDDEVPF